ncbi:Eco57I restriction-modification methylase domain-containing protein [Helicobacter suis]|uniref:Eco57I restriction-modification methylase domain-containing protein n=1 Tax=Helicobacter suis TaxID=104628 RepID=UPI0019675A14|nr:N-6 DNA methylase [Helicobacter suis]
MRFITNNLFTPYTLNKEFPDLYHFDQSRAQAKQALDRISALNVNTQSNEHQFEDAFIAPVLEILGWQFLRQEEKIIQGKLEKPDFLLFATKECLSKYTALEKDLRRASNEYFAVILESKACSVILDNGKVENNPHYQILHYCNALRHDYGFLTNGRFWRFYNTSTLSTHKVFFEVHLEGILQNQDLDSFLYFYHLFSAQNFAPKDSPIEKTLECNAKNIVQIEQDLSSLIYGTNGQDSLFEDIGAALYAVYAKQTKEEEVEILLKNIYENTLYFLFRLLFIAYFEDRFLDSLKDHPALSHYLSLYTLLEDEKWGENSASFVGMARLEEIFRVYNAGNANYSMPLFNGGLFEESKNTLFTRGQIINDTLLKRILTKLFYYDRYKRGYSMLSISHLGSMYEGLLSYQFALASEELYYCVYTSNEGYFDSYDLKDIKEKPKRTQRYTQGQLYLKNSANSRKASGSFYTPEKITKELVSVALSGLNDTNILNFKILDNACGSGAFLIEALHQVSQRALSGEFPSIKPLLEQEKQIVEEQIKKCSVPNFALDESALIKRLVLKNLIYGIDKNPFAIELAKLALWIDSFVFGTPLSFLEPHLKCGDALLGCTLEEFKEFLKKTGQIKKSIAYQGSVFAPNFFEEFKKLQEDFKALTSIKDTTQEQIEHSKELFKKAKPTLDKLNLYLNFYNTDKLMQGLPKNHKDRQWWEEHKNFKDKGLDKLLEEEEVKGFIQRYALEFRFFNYEIAFPEVVEDNQICFNAIVGNPPWEKTKFDESEFFASLRSNYRRLSLKEQEELRLNLLYKRPIKTQFEQEKEHIQTLNAYYKAYYPLSRGSGDGNLFRFFIERQLGLLAKGARLCVLIPSALMLEEGSIGLRSHILEKFSPEFFYSFENRKKIFEDVHSCYKFALFGLSNARPKANATIKALFYCEHIEQIKELKPLLIPVKELLNTKKRALKEVRNALDLEIAKHCEAQFNKLSTAWLNFRQELNMTSDKDLFIEQESVKQIKTNTKGANIQEENAKRFLGQATLPLLEGKYIHQFNARFNTPRYKVERTRLEQRLKSKESFRAKKAGYMGAITFEHQYFRLGYREVARDTDERSLIVSLIAKNCTAGHSMFLSIPYVYTKEGIVEIKPLQLLFALGLLNSLVLDFIIRLRAQINITKTCLLELPLPQPSLTEIKNNPTFLQIALSALECQLFNDKAAEFEALKGVFEGRSLDVPKTSKLYDLKRAQLDILIAREVYGLSQEQFFHLLDSFKVLAKKQPGFVALLKSLWGESEAFS